MIVFTVNEFTLLNFREVNSRLPALVLLSRPISCRNKVLLDKTVASFNIVRVIYL